jgi:hypothetical protein
MEYQRESMLLPVKRAEILKIVTKLTKGTSDHRYRHGDEYLSYKHAVD